MSVPFLAVPSPVPCANGGSYISGPNKEGCGCPTSYYENSCQKKLVSYLIINIFKIFVACRLCAAYVKLKSPETALYKGLSSSSPNHTRYRLTYRTRYTTRVKCKEDL